MNKWINIIKNVLLVLIVLLIVFIAGYWFGSKSNENEGEIVEDDGDSPDLELPGEVERRVVTVEEVETKLSEIGELSTYAGEYTVTLSSEETRYLLEDIEIWGTTNTIEVSCNGIVKVGYNMADISVQVNDDTIYISIPEAKLNDNYVIWDSVVCTESNSILNPIEFSQYQSLIDDIEQKGLEEVEAQGIYDSAEENLKKIINEFLSEFTDYKIVYM